MGAGFVLVSVWQGAWLWNGGNTATARSRPAASRGSGVVWLFVNEVAAFVAEWLPGGPRTASFPACCRTALHISTCAALQQLSRV